MHTRVIVGRIIMYAILYVIILLFFIFFHSYVFLMLLVIMTVMVPVSLASGLYLERKMDFELLNLSEKVERFEISYLRFMVKNPTYFLTLDVKANLICENTFYGYKDYITIAVPSRIHSTYNLEIPMHLTMNGNIKYSIEDVRMIDILGFIEMHKKVNLKTEINVFPESDSTFKGSMTDLSAGMSEVEETKKKGYDFSDVTDVREYIPGDKLMNIHWKLSAKKDMFMVKERENMSSNELVILVELYQNEDMVLNDILTAVYGVGTFMADNRIPFNLFYWSVKNREMVNTYVQSRGDLVDWMRLVYFEKPYREEGLGREMYLRMGDPDRRYMFIGPQDGPEGEIVFSTESGIKGYLCN